MNLSDVMFARFRGREDYLAVGNGDAFHPEHSANGQTLKRLESEHLAGERCLGFYVLDAQAKCCATMVDFDNKESRPDPRWKEKAEQTYYELQRIGLSPLVEVSQSGKAAHVWLFFAEPTDGWVPRAFWRALMHRLSIPCPEIYPRQSEHSAAEKLGNLVRFPLWQQSAFVDVESDWTPIDPIDALNGVQLLTASDLRLVAFQAGMGELQPEPRIEIAEIQTGGKLSLRVQRLVAESGTLLGRRWRGDATGMADQSRSAVAMSLCCELVRAYIPTPEIQSALDVWLREHDPEDKYGRDKWRNDTVLKAYGYVVQRREQKSVSVTTFRDAAHSYVDLIEQNCRVFVPSGISELDASIDGVAPGEVCIIAGRPSHGKSAVAFQWLANAAKMGVSSLLIYEEMGAVEIGKRRLQSVTPIPQEQWVAASAASLRKDIDKAHRAAKDVYIVESCNTIDRVEEVFDQFCQLYDVGLVALDYLQLLGARTKERYEVVTECSRRIKQAARRNGVAVLLLSQLNRSVENRDENEPKLSDLRESGQIEQDADLILFTQYPCRFDHKSPDDLYRIIAAKRRNGPIREARIETKFNPHRQIIGFPMLPDDLLDL